MLPRKSTRIAAQAEEKAKAKEKEAESTATVIATGTSADSPKLPKPSPKTKKATKKKESPKKEPELDTASVQALLDEENAKQAKEKAQDAAISGNKRGIASCKNAIKIIFGILRNEKRERKKLGDAINKTAEDLSNTIVDQGRHAVVVNDIIDLQRQTLFTVQRIVWVFVVFLCVAFFIGMKVVDAFGDDAFTAFYVVAVAAFIIAICYYVVMGAITFAKNIGKRIFGWE